MNRFHGCSPILSVKDVPASVIYYTEKLGFKKKWDWGEPATFAAVTRGGVDLFLCQGSQGKPGTWIMIFVDDVDALHEDYKASGVAIRQPPTNFPWGVREMNVADPDGHRIRFGSETDAPSDGVPLAED